MIKTVLGKEISAGLWVPRVSFRYYVSVLTNTYNLYSAQYCGPVTILSLGPNFLTFYDMLRTVRYLGI